VEANKDKLLIQSLTEVFKDKCLVGPTSGSYGIALYNIAEKLRETCGIHIKALPLFGTDIPSGKLEIIKQCHVREWGASPLAKAENRATRERDSLRKLLELVEEKNNGFDGGFFVATNPTSMAELETLAAIAVDKAKSLSEVPEWKRDILSNLGIAVDVENNALTITTAYADHAAGTELYAKDILKAFPDAHVNAFYPISAGAGAMGPLLQAKKHSGHMHVLLAPDPANKGWQEHIDQNGQHIFEKFYVRPAALSKEINAKPCNGLGTTPQPRAHGDAVTWLVEEGIASRQAEFLPTTGVIRQIARAIMALDEMHQSVFDEPVLLPELASATSAGALLTRAIENTDTVRDVQKLARLATRELFRRGFDEMQFLQLVVCDEQQTGTLNVAETWDELKGLTKLQGERDGNTPNKVEAFMQELQNAFAEFSKSHGRGFYEAEKPRDVAINFANVTVIPITGRNSGIAILPKFVVKHNLLAAKAA
jgi:hypothetical protein